MFKKLILRDAIGVWLLLTASLCGGLSINEIRPNPLPLFYTSPDMRMQETVAHVDRVSNSSISREGDVNLEEMQKISSSRAALIIDARPEVFYRLGHIPSALSLPRDDFENQYRAMEPILRAYRNNVLVVYCAGNDCRDSQMVGDALGRLGFAHVRVFRGGWGDWENGHLPEDHE